MLDPQWKQVRHGAFGWYLDDTDQIAALWLQDASFADASAKFSGAISKQTAEEIRQHLRSHAATISPTLEFMDALESSELMAFRLGENLGGGTLVVLPDGFMSTVPIGQQIQPEDTDEAAEANAPAVRQLFEATKSHVLAELASTRGSDSLMTNQLSQILSLAVNCWELILLRVSRQTLDCFDTQTATLKTFLLRDQRLFFAVSTLPCARDDAPECLKQQCDTSEYPYASLIGKLACQHDSAEFDFLIHSVITCNPSNHRMSLQLGVFPNAENMKSPTAIKLFPVEVITSSERALIGL